MSQDALPVLLNRIQHGDEVAAHEFMRLYEPQLRRFVRYNLTDRKVRLFIDSLDVTQSVFAKLFLKLAQGECEIENPRQLFKLLQMMATNKVRDHIRRERAAKRNYQEGDNQRVPLETISEETMPDLQQTDNQELVDLIRGKLSTDEQSVLDLRMSGEGWKQIAQAMDSSPDAVRKRLSRAIDRVTFELGMED